MKRTPLKPGKPLKRTAMKRKKAKKKKTPSATTLRKKCDAMWGKIIRSVEACEFCGASDCLLHAHHLIRRESIYYRHNPKNGVCLCASHHMYDGECSAHGAPRGFSEKLATMLPEQSEWWDANRHTLHIGEKPDYAARLAGLQAMYDAIQSGKATREDFRDWSD